MKVRFMICVVLLCLASPLFGAERAPIQDKRDRLSYTIGVDIGTTLKKQAVDVNLDVLKEAIGHVLSGTQLRLTEKEMGDVRAAMEKEVSGGKADQLKAHAEKNRRDEEKFFSENKSKEGIVTLSSGLQYRVVTEGTGKAPTEDDAVSVHYRVTLLDGKEIESSKGEPATFVVENVIPGWKEGILKMRTGSKWQLFVPSRLAYGEDGLGEMLAPNSMLIFDLELVRVLDKTDENPDNKTLDNGQGKDTKEQ
jgi:FKBP-type peptidyl-prolyl cis-trans isomerase FklB